jgi:hypothetical protein
MRALLLLSVVVMLGCDPSVMIGSPVDAGTSDAGTSDAGVMVTDAGTGPQIVGGCPRVRLGRSTEVTFTADTSTLPNLVQSTRLEWTDAPDDALEFIADQTGNYAIELTSTNGNLGVSAEGYSGSSTVRQPFSSTACPPSGLVVSIDGVYNHNQPGYPVPLTAGQSMVVFISAPCWAAVKTGTYTLVIKRVL